MRDLPEPFTQPECDLRGYDFMPIFGHRLFGSEFYAKATDAEFRAAVKLWWTAWLQCPAGSLPNDDNALCRYADLGRDQRSWKRVKAAALHGFVLCSDGRLYHKVLCEEAERAWERRCRDRERKAKMRAGRTNFAPPQDDQLIEIAKKTPEMSVGQGVGQDAEQGWDVRVDRTETETETGTGTEVESHSSVHQKQNITTGAADSENPKPKPTILEPRRTFEPRRNDGPGMWTAAYPFLETRGDANAVKRPIVGTDRTQNWCFLMEACEAVCVAARIQDRSWAGDWHYVIDWIGKWGFNLHRHILPAITKVAAQARYTQPRTLKYFDGPIRNYVELHKDAA